MDKSDFAFIRDGTTRENIQNVRADITLLMAMVPQVNRDVRHCLRKTIIIYTASIIEALLLWKVKKEFGTGKITLPDEWKQHILYTIPQRSGEEEKEGCKITLTRHTKERKDADKMDFNRMLRLCRHAKTLPVDLLSKMDTVRNMRNTLHIGGLKTATKIYSQKDVDFSLETLAKVMRLIR
ncbi:MAG: hypothetical protein OXB96_03170 [Candidatus Kaiserbacteria bacterium]|nr:hypothetical protein [Candidatus Kaiserbacteria bacterium]